MVSILPYMTLIQLQGSMGHGPDWFLIQAGLERVTNGLIVSYTRACLLFIMDICHQGTTSTSETNFQHT